MKKKYVRLLILPFVMLLLLTPLNKICSQEVVFNYDECGNRISEEVILLKDLTTENGQPGTDDPESAYLAAIKNVQITISPNPTGGRFDVRLENLNPDNDARLELHDMHGELLLSRGKLAATNQIDIDRQRKGTYILSIMIDGIRKTWKVIKQ